MQQRAVYLCFVSVMLLWSSAVSAAPSTSPVQEKVITIAAEDNWPPFSDEKGRGLSFNLVQAALKQAGYQLKTVVVPYARAVYYNEHGMVDGHWNVSKQLSTSERFLLHQVPLFRASSSFYFYKAAKNFTTMAAIPDRAVVGVLLGYEYGDEFERHKKRFSLVEVSTHQQLVKLLQAEKLDVALFYDDVLRFYLKQWLLADPLIIRGAENFVSELFIAFDKNNEQSQQKADALDQGLRQLQQSGEYQRLLDAFQAGMQAQ